MMGSSSVGRVRDLQEPFSEDFQSQPAPYN